MMIVCAAHVQEGIRRTAAEVVVVLHGHQPACIAIQRLLLQLELC